MENTPTTSWIEDGQGGIAVLAYGPAPLLDLLEKAAHQHMPSQIANGRMLWFREAGIDEGFDLMRLAVDRGEMRVYPPIGSPVVIRVQPIPPSAILTEEK